MFHQNNLAHKWIRFVIYAYNTVFSLGRTEMRSCCPVLLLSKKDRIGSMKNSGVVLSFQRMLSWIDQLSEPVLIYHQFVTQGLRET